MLSRRQENILQYLYRCPEKTASTSQICSHFHVGIRSIQNDIRTLNRNEPDTGIQIVSDGRKSLHLVLSDLPKAAAVLIPQAHTHHLPFQFNHQMSRIDYDLALLLNAKKPIPSAELEKKTFLSHSQMAMDLRRMRELIRPFRLELNAQAHQGLMLEGKESDRRSLIASRNLDLTDADHPSFGETFPKETDLSRLLTEALLKYQFRVSDIVFQNLLVQLSIAILRIQNGFFLEDSAKLPYIYLHAMDIASDVFHSCCSQYRIPYMKEEAKHFAADC